jgi:putative transposase
VTVSRPPSLRVGDEVEVGGAAHTVTWLSGSAVGLAGVTGAETSMTLAELLTAPGFRMMTRSPAALPPRGLMEILPDGAADQALWWERHIIEVIAGVPPDAPAGTRPRPGYDPQARTLRQRELAKAGELAEAGRPVPLSTLQRLRLAYEKRGAWGLVDHRAAPRPGARTDKRVIEAIAKAVSEETDESTGTVDRLRRRVEKILEGDGTDPAAVMPARATFYRLAARADSGKHTFGSARSRRSQAKTPEGPYGTVTAARPGEWTQIDSTPLDVRVVLDNGMTDRAELTWVIDIATRTIPAAVLRTSTKAVDAALLLARSMTPEPMRPGWPDALRMSRSVLPHRRLADIDRRLADAAARPVIVPETIACDHGSVYMSQAFRGACRAMGITLQPSHEGSPWEKGTVETSFSAVGTLFAQYVAGYTGSSVEHRGKDPDGDAAWSMAELQDLLDEWVVTTWNNRPHAGLSHPLMPGRELTPNEMYAALVETAGYVPVPLAASDYVELLPVTWRKINAYGVKIGNRTYDCRALTPCRRQHSGVNAKKGSWEVRFDPHDITRVWVRDHLGGGGWILAPWTHLRTAPAPFGEQAWEHARKMLARRGEDPVTEGEIARAAAALLDRAEQGPAKGPEERRDRKATARARAESAAGPSVPEEETPQPAGPPAWDDGEEDGDGPLADVIPLGIFDAREEAKKWW